MASEQSNGGDVDDEGWPKTFETNAVATEVLETHSLAAIALVAIVDDAADAASVLIAGSVPEDQLDAIAGRLATHLEDAARSLRVAAARRRRPGENP